MTTSTAPPVSAAAEAVAERFLAFYGTLEGAGELFAPDVLVDVNVPLWRMQYRGPGPFVAWLREHTATGYTTIGHRSIPTPSGVVIELDAEYEHRNGEHYYFRNVWLLTAADGRISEATLYCTGDWDADTRRRHAAQAPMVGR